MNSNEDFEKIYLLNNPIFARIYEKEKLKERLTTSYQFASILNERIIGVINTKKIASETPQRQKEQIIKNIISTIFDLNKSNDSPFAVLDNSNRILIFKDNIDHFNRVSAFLNTRNKTTGQLNNKFITRDKHTGNKETTEVSGVVYVNENFLRTWIMTISQWAINNNQILQNKINVIFGNSEILKNIIADEFIRLYKIL